MGGEAVCELGTVVRLEAFNRTGKGFDKVFHKHGRRISAVFLKSFYKTPSGILINGGILEEMLSNYLTIYKAGGRDKFHIHLNALSRMIHLLVRLWDILWIGRMNRHNALFFEEAVESSKGAGITTLHEFNPENNKTCMGVTSAQIGNKLNLIRGMLFRVVVRSAGKSRKDSMEPSKRRFQR